MEVKKDYIQILRLIRQNYERDWWLREPCAKEAFDDIMEAIDKAIEALKKMGYETPSQCPFCGGKSTVKSETNEGFYVKCEQCGARTQVEPTPAIAIDKWNYRVKPRTH